ncbi:uncharacterized protein ACR2FA_004986 [Aphomia sociella]
MNGFNKAQADRNLCKNHSNKCERELYRICPSKLSKKELEDLYFALLENNLELKKTINSQQENVKLLSTKVQRMTASQRNNLVKENKDCCAATKAVVQEQKASIADLKKANERMSERIRVLNMRLCSAKQFLRRSPSQITSRCFKCLTAAPASMKNSSVSVLNTRRSDSIAKTAAASSQYLYNEATTRNVETDTCDLDKESSDKMCDENKCQTLMEELKQKIVNLQEELSRTHEQHSARTRALQRLQQQRGARDSDLAARLRDQDSRCNELSTQLSIEKSKVAELEMRLKAADMSAQIAKTIDTHLTNLNEFKQESSKVDQQFGTSSPLPLPNWEGTPSRLDVTEPSISRLSPDSGPSAQFKHSDDSGYTDVNRSHEYDDNSKKEFSPKGSREQSPDSGVHAEQNRGKERTANVSKVNELWDSYDEPVASNKIVEGNVSRPIKMEQLTLCLEKDKGSASTTHPINIASNMKSDSHNSLQIPGPLPVDSTETTSTSKEKPWSRAKRRFMDGKLKRDSILSTYSSNKDNENKQHGITIQNSEMSVATTQFYPNKDNIADLRLALDGSEGSLKIRGKKILSLDEANLEVENDVKRNVKTLCASNGTQIEATPVTDTAVQVELKDRSQLGTRIDNEQQIQQNIQQQLRSQQQSRQASPLSGRTYSLGGAPVTSDTDCEISSLTDLPDERDAGLVSYREPLSPGEHKATSTSEYSTSYSAPAHHGDLSDGELPALTVKKHSAELKQPSPLKPVQPMSTSQKVEEALQTIGEELARCRELLQIQRPLGYHKASKDASTSVDICPSQIALRRAVANPHIGNSLTPNCIFTLHIGTLVLSDEAVLNSRDMSLLLTWKFYVHNVGMTRMRAGRVVLFDFSTEYDVKMNNDFLNYLKYGEMPIIISELNKQDKPFASCALPLRDALLHTNKRADMSLALIEGPGMRRGRGTADALVAGDEVGVLDLWCLLRPDPALLPAINRAIARPSPLMSNSKSSFGNIYNNNTDIMKRIIEDDQSNEERLLQDLDIHLGNRAGRSQMGVERNIQQNDIKPMTGLAKMEDKQLVARRLSQKSHRPSLTKKRCSKQSNNEILTKRDACGTNTMKSVYKNVVRPHTESMEIDEPPELYYETSDDQELYQTQSFGITILWLALNEECEAMTNPSVQRLYVAYSLLGRSGAEYETPVSLPKPKNYMDKCEFNFKKLFQVNDCDLPLLGHMAKCRSANVSSPDPKDCIIFSVISEPPEDPLGLDSCEDIGYAYLYLGDVLSCSAGCDSYTDVVPLRSVYNDGAVCGVLALKIGGLDMVRKCLLLSTSQKDLSISFCIWAYGKSDVLVALNRDKNAQLIGPRAMAFRR